MIYSKDSDTYENNASRKLEALSMKTLPEPRRPRLRLRKPPQTAAEVVEQFANERKTKLQSRVKSSTTVRKSIAPAWKLAYLEAFGKEPPLLLSPREVGVFMNNSKNVNLPPVRKLFEDICTHWYDLKHGPMKWVKGMPENPEFGFVARFVRHVVEGLEQIATASTQGVLGGGHAFTALDDGARLYTGRRALIAREARAGDFCDEDGDIYQRLGTGRGWAKSYYPKAQVAKLPTPVPEQAPPAIPRRQPVRRKSALQESPAMDDGDLSIFE
jgi:hypothetical protein